VEKLDQQLRTIDTTLLSEGSGIALRQRKLLAVMSLSPRWSKLVTLLEDHTVPEVFYRNISVDNSGEVILSAEAPDFETAAKQWVAFKRGESWVQKVDIAGVAAGALEDDDEITGVSFGVSLEIDMKQLQEEISLEDF